jgi:hypothetical protein
VSGVKKAGLIVSRKCIKIFQSFPPKPTELSVFHEGLGHITQSGGSSILRGYFRDPGTAADLDAEIKDRKDNRHGADQLRHRADSFPIHL